MDDVSVRYKYSTADELKEESYWGQVAVYGGGGYTQVLPNTSDTLQHVLVQLQADEWIDAGTRAVFIDFTAYNMNDNLFAVVRCVWSDSVKRSLKLGVGVYKNTSVAGLYSQEFATGGGQKRGSGRRKSPRGVQGRAPIGVWGRSRTEAGDKC